MEFYRLWRIVLRYKGLIAAVTFTGTVAAVALTYALPSLYEASSLVIVRPEEKIRLSPNQGEGKEVLDFPVSHAAPIDAPSKTYMEVLQSEAVAARIVTALHLDAPRQIEQGSAWKRFRDEFRVWVKETIRSSRHIMRYGRVIPATRFERAVEDLREYLALEVKKNTYAFSISYTSGDPQIAAAVANKAAEIFLAHNAEAYRSEAEVSRKFIESRMVESENVLRDAREELRRFKSEAGVFALDDEYRERIKVISSLEVDMQSAEARLAGLREVYGSENTKVASAQAEVAGLRRALAGYKAGLTGMPERERRLGALELAVSVAQQDYEYIRKKYEESRIAEQTSFAEIRTVSPATVPLYPVRPIKYYYGGLGFLVGLVGSIAVALFLEYLNPRVHVADDLTNVLDVPLLAAIPLMKPARARR